MFAQLTATNTFMSSQVSGDHYAGKTRQQQRLRKPESVVAGSRELRQIACLLISNFPLLTRRKQYQTSSWIPTSDEFIKSNNNARVLTCCHCGLMPLV